MTRIYSTGEVCGKPGDSNPNACYKLDPGKNDYLHVQNNIEKKMTFFYQRHVEFLSKACPEF